jgi:hypothetical protein
VKIMKLAIFLLASLIVFISGFAYAFPEYATAGPYYLLFDTGLSPQNYSINITGPEGAEFADGGRASAYNVIVSSNTKDLIIEISLLDFGDSLNQLTANELEQRLRGELSENATNLEIVNRIMDHAVGAVCSYDLLFDNHAYKSYGAMYQPLFDQGRLLVDIASSFPWDQGTSQLLSTIHVGKVNSTEPTHQPSTEQPSYTPAVSTYTHPTQQVLQIGRNNIQPQLPVSTITSSSYSPRLWINTANGPSTYVQCSASSNMQLMLYVPTSGYVTINEIYPDGRVVVSNYYFPAGQSYHGFYADRPGRHQLYLTSGNDNSNEITIDVI